MVRHNLKQVDEKIRQAAQSYLERQLGRILDDVELRIAQQLANEGKPRLAIERVSLAFLDYGARLDDLERPKQVRQATPEEYVKLAREWLQIFPDSEPPSTWRLEAGRK